MINILKKTLGLRTCKKCNKTKPIRDFSKRGDNGLRRYICYDCARVKAKERYAEARAVILAEREKYKREHPLTSIKCRICHKNKPLSEYIKRKGSDRYRYECHDCRKALSKAYHEAHKEELNARARIYGKKYRENPNNKEHLAQKSKEWYEKNKDRIREHRRENGIRYYYENRERELERHRRYDRENRTKINERQRIYRAKRKEYDPVFKLKLQVRSLAWSALWAKGYKKNTKTEKLVGCTIDKLIQHLLRTYRENYGTEWDGKEPVHIDHIVPLSTAKTEQEAIELFNYNNLQLLKAHDNLVKHDSASWELKNSH